MVSTGSCTRTAIRSTKQIMKSYHIFPEFLHFRTPPAVCRMPYLCCTANILDYNVKDENTLDFVMMKFKRTNERCVVVHLYNVCCCKYTPCTGQAR